MSFVGFRCWDASDVDTIAPIDVAGIPHEGQSGAAVFFATHEPLSLLRLPGFGAVAGQTIGESDLLAEFTRPVGSDPQITVITGAVGTGKSHMVKWLHAQCAHRLGWHQVYIEKRNTNLRRVIETILEGLSGPQVVELRELLRIAAASLRDLDEAKHKVLLELTHFVEYPSAGSPASNDFEIEVRRQLPHILGDPVLRQHLLGTQGAVHRITRLGLEGLSGEDEDEHHLFFAEGDLPLQPYNLVDASQPGQKAIRRLGSNERLRSTAVEVLNAELAAAKSAVFVGSGVHLTSVFDEVRRELRDRGLELVLYIEDLVLLHGIDRGLAQVFTEGRGKDGDRCGMRVAIAVTEGYLASGLDTLTSRAQHYSLNLRLDTDVLPDQARAFVGRYFNAIRLGPARLQSARTALDGTDWVPNACTSCDYHENCHSAFGRDTNGYGLYPLNDTAVDRLVALADAATTNEGRFDPRKVIRHVVRDPLGLAAEELPDGRFPSSSFAASLDPTRKSVSVEVRAQLSREDDGDRRMALLGFWAAPAPVQTVVNLDPIIHDAFQLPRRSGALTVGSGDTAGQTQIDPPPPVVEYPQIDAWVNEQSTLPAPLARVIRQYIFTAVSDTIRNGASGLRVQNRGQNRRIDVGRVSFDETAVRIVAAQGGGAEVQRPFEILIDRSPETAVMLKALVRAASQGTWPSDADQQYAVFMEYLDRWCRQLAAKASERDIDLEPAVRVLALTSQPGIAGAASPGERLEVAMLHQVDPDPRGPVWTSWARVAKRSRDLALAVIERAVCSSKGAGGSSFMDGAALMRHLEKAGGIRRFGDKLSGSQQLVDVQRQLRDQQETATAAVWSEADRLIAELHTFIGAAATWEAIQMEIGRAIGASRTAGLLPDASAASRLEDLLSEVPRSAAAVLARIARNGDAKRRELWDLVPDPIPSLEALAAYCRYASHLLTEVEDRLSSEGSLQSGEVGRGTTILGIRQLADNIDAHVRA